MSKTRSILFLGTQMETGGAQRLLLEQAEWFYKKGWQVKAAFLYDKEGLLDQWRAKYPFPIGNMRARRFGASIIENVFRLVFGLVRTIHFISSGNFDVIETFTHHSNLIGIPIAWLAGIKVRVATHHGAFFELDSITKKLHTMVINSRLTTCFVVVSEMLKPQVEREGVKKDNILVIPNGVKLVELDSRSAREKIRKELNIPFDDLVVISAGRLRPEKGHDLLINAIPSVLDVVPNTYFLIAGDGTLRNDLEERAARSEIKERIRFLGFKTNIPELIAASDLFVLPSRTEGMAMVLLEAMSEGKAIVAYDVGGNKELVEHEVTGLLSKPEDCGDLAKNVIEMLKNREKRERFGVCAKQKILEFYTLEKMCASYEELFLLKLEDR